MIKTKYVSPPAKLTRKYKRLKPKLLVSAADILISSLPKNHHLVLEGWYYCSTASIIMRRCQMAGESKWRCGGGYCGTVIWKLGLGFGGGGGASRVSEDFMRFVRAFGLGCKGSS